MVKTPVKKHEIKGGIKKSVSSLQKKLIMNSKTHQAIAMEVAKPDCKYLHLTLQSASMEEDVLIGVKAHPLNFSILSKEDQRTEVVQIEIENGSMATRGGSDGKAGDTPRV